MRSTLGAIIRRNTRQPGTNVRLSLAERRIVVDSEDADTALAASAENIRLTRKRAVAVDAHVAAGGDDVLVVEGLGGGVVCCEVVVRAAGQTCLDEGWVDACVVGEGCDEGRVD